MFFSGLPCAGDFSTTLPQQPTTNQSITDSNVRASDAKPELSALSNRNTYTEFMKGNISPRAALNLQMNVVRPLRHKTGVRNMRLRPRQVLCSNCKSAIHNTVAVKTTKDKLESSQSSSVCEVSQTTASRVGSDLDLTDDESATKKRRLRDDAEKIDADAVLTDSYFPEPVAQCNPVIKILYATPHGEGTVVKILRPNAATDAVRDKLVMSSPLSSVEGGQTPDRCQPPRRAVKRGKERDKCPPVTDVSSPVTDVSNPVMDVSNPVTDVSNPVVDVSNPVTRVTHKKRSKRRKHKGKRKRRHRAVEPSVGVQSEDEHSKENVAANGVGVDGDAAAAAATSWDVTASCSDDGGSESLCDSDVGLECYSIVTNSDASSLKRTICKVHAPLAAAPRAVSPLRPLMMRIHTRTVATGTTANGQPLTAGDVVWGKIHGFPWWPGRVGAMTESRTDGGAVVARLAHISWFGSSTVSHMPCAQLCPFLEDFALRYNRKKRGAYKRAIKQATLFVRGHADALPSDDLASDDPITSLDDE